MNRIVTVALVLMSLLVSGCAPRVVTPDQRVLAQLKDAPVLHLVSYPPPVFEVVNPGNSLTNSSFGISGGTIAVPSQGVAAGNFATTYALEDPAKVIRARLAERLKFELGLSHLNETVEPLEEDGLTALRDTLHTGWVLEVRTMRWALVHDPEVWTQYRINYESRVRLIRLDDSNIVWNEICDASKRGSSGPMGALTADGATLLKDRLRDAAESCVDVFAAHFIEQIASPRQP